MKSCIHCGHESKDDAQFCINCGQKFVAVPVPSLPVPPSSSTSEGNTSAAKQLPWLWVGVVVAVVLVVGGALAVWLTYRAEVWGGKTVPDPQVVAQESSDKDVSAQQVVVRLQDQGFAVKKTSEFSGKPRGSYMAMRGVRPGERVPAGSEVTVVESAGPGVPKQVIGKPASQVVTQMESMGVPVEYKKVVSDSAKPGTVVSSSPAAGSALPQGQKVMYIGVAASGEHTVPADLIGMDKHKAVEKLEEIGVSAELKPKFCSQDRIGKICESSITPGKEVSAGTSATLYYGVDASAVKKLFTVDNEYTSYFGAPNDFLTGKYCKQDSDDCITFVKENKSGNWFNTYEEHDKGDFRFLDASDETKITTEAPGTVKRNRDLLIDGDTGAFELMPSDSKYMYYCGNKALYSIGVGGPACRNGQVQPYGTYDYREPRSGSTFRMDNFYLYVPVGADIKKLEQSGYFDAQALQKAKSEGGVDTTRPFVVMRDKSLYSDAEKEVSADAKDGKCVANPFIPHIFSECPISGGTRVKMRPAISDTSVYYLVEESSANWDELPDATVEVDSNKTLN